jgi:hypothetical protein
MMTDKLREAAQAVGDAKDILFLREMSVHDKVYLRLEDAINALKAELAEPTVQESLTVAEQKPMLEMNPQKREWVGLTDDEIDEIGRVVIGFNSLSGWENEFGLAIETKLREKNT